jgi:hypothetical protein
MVKPVALMLKIVDMELRRAEPPDAIAVARVHVRSWQAAYRKLIPDDYLDQLRPEDRAKKYDFGSLDPLRPCTIVATESGRILGFGTTASATLAATNESCVLTPGKCNQAGDSAPVISTSRHAQWRSSSIPVRVPIREKSGRTQAYDRPRTSRHNRVRDPSQLYRCRK